MKEFAINQTYYKVLLTISELNKKSYYPLNEGVFKILAGVIDDETSNFVNLVTFGTLTSYSSKKICHLTLMLFRHELIGKIFDPESKKLYLRTTEKGEYALDEFAKKHKCSFARKKAKSAITIAKIA
ncbi:MAG: hypothetical protein IJR08_01040 [Bacilli bacterium]|nr:hypothetical protein [Bacilli bacterium]